ncbi:MAG: extracellular solute-binding protein, partial [Clostridia bacterium]|nr:extracellular solute-binding protein [Clostridia bacterium]
MKKLISIVLTLVLAFAACISLAACTENANEDQYTADGKLVLNVRNLYFNEWNGDDVYTAEIEKKFGVKFSPSSYSWADWTQQVQQSINGGNVSDVFHFNLDNYNFARSYKFWAEDGVIKPLPDDLSRWPNIKSMIDKTSNIDALKTDGKLYCIPIAKNIKSKEAPFSPFTYVYRRDWAKQLGVYQEDDIYTFEQFKTLLSAFNAAYSASEISALADVEWGFPSVVNLFKTEPHCFAVSGGQAVASYTTDKYIEGLEFAKQLVEGGVYYGDQFSANDGDVSKRYYGGRVGVFYENLSLSNYTTLRKKMWERSEIDTKEKLDDATAIMKVMAPDGKYALEGTDNWFSATFFSGGISDAKQEKLLDIMDWLLSDEGTLMAVYGIEGYDYVKSGDKITLTEAGWEKDQEGKYIEKYNGAKYLRYMCTLGYDTYASDPLVDKDCYDILTDWSAFMTGQYDAGNL